jgi:antitoxin (DNA-binding transcriptional repressor) of toxin-antitoxin stability system
MKTEVKIAEFKAKLSECLRFVRQGNELIIEDGLPLKTAS